VSLEAGRRSPHAWNRVWRSGGLYHAARAGFEHPAPLFRPPLTPWPGFVLQDKLDEAMADTKHWMWDQFDKNRDGFITQAEAIQQGGLVDFVREVRRRAPSR